VSAAKFSGGVSSCAVAELPAELAAIGGLPVPDFAGLTTVVLRCAAVEVVSRASGGLAMDAGSAGRGTPVPVAGGVAALGAPAGGVAGTTATGGAAVGRIPLRPEHPAMDMIITPAAMQHCRRDAANVRAETDMKILE